MEDCAFKDMGKGVIGVKKKTEQKSQTIQTNSKHKSTDITLIASPKESPKGLSQLQTLWISHVNKLGITSCITAKEGKMLRDAAHKIGYEKVLNIVPVVVAHWKAFTEFCYYQGVGYTLPQDPQVGFFLKFLANADKYVQRQQQEATEKEKKAASKIKLEEMTTVLLQLDAHRDEMMEAALAVEDGPLTLKKKQAATGFAETRHITHWEKYCGPITTDYFHPAFDPPGIYAMYRDEPDLFNLSKRPAEVAKVRDYLAGIRKARLLHELRDTSEFRALAEKRDAVNDRIASLKADLKL